MMGPPSAGKSMFALRYKPCITQVGECRACQAQQAARRSELEHWREDARRTGEESREKSEERATTRDRGKDQDGPDYER